MISYADEINTHSFFLQCQDFARRRRMGQDQDYRRQGSMDLPSRPNFQSSGRTQWPSQHAPIPTLELRPPLYCTKQEKESVMITANIRKLETTRRNTDAPKIGVPHQRSNLGISPQSLLEGVSKSSPDTKKNHDFQYLKDDGKPLMILVFLP